MARQPDQRYASPAELAEDLERFLADEPVTAFVEPVSVRARRWIKRHPAIASATAACLVLGLTSAVFVAWLNGQHAAALADKNVTIAGQLVALQERAGTIAKQKTELETKNQQLTVATSEALAAEKIAKEQKAQAEAVTDFLVSSFRKADPVFDGKKLTVYECLVRARQEIDERPNFDPRSKARILNAMMQSFIGLGLGAEAVDAGVRCLEIRRQEQGVHHPESLVSQHNLGSAYVIAGQPEQAIPLLEPLLTIRQEGLGPANPHTLQTQNSLAVAYKNAGRLDQAIRLQKSTLETLRSALGKNHPLTLTCQHNLALAHAAAGDGKAAIALLEQTLEAQKSALGNDHPDSLLTQSHLATSYRAAGRPDLAIPVLESVLKTQRDKLGDDHPALFVTRTALAHAYKSAGKLHEAIALDEETLRWQTAKLGARNPHTLQTQNNLAMAYLDAEKYELGIPLAEAALKILREDFGNDHPDTLHGRMNLATLYHGSGKLDLAIPEYEATLKGLKATRGDDHSHTLQCQSNLAVALRSAGKNKQALPLFEATLNARQLKEGPEHPDTLTAAYNLALALGTDGQQEAALRRMQATTLVACRRTGGFPESLWELPPELVRKYDQAGIFDRDDESTPPALQTILDHYDKPTPQSASALADLCLQLLRRENFTDAEPLCLATLATANKVAPESWLISQAQSLLGASLAGQGKLAAAEPLLQSGYAGLVAQEAQIPTDSTNRIHAAILRLIDLYSAWGKSAEADEWRAEQAKQRAGVR
jgi:tetratricopeptide (TPR) repeat protein